MLHDPVSPALCLLVSLSLLVAYDLESLEEFSYVPCTVSLNLGFPVVSLVMRQGYEFLEIIVQRTAPLITSHQGQVISHNWSLVMLTFITWPWRKLPGFSLYSRCSSFPGRVFGNQSPSLTHPWGWIFTFQREDHLHTVLGILLQWRLFSFLPFVYLFIHSYPWRLMHFYFLHHHILKINSAWEARVSVQLRPRWSTGDQI